jgi:hypothetical protein
MIFNENRMINIYLKMVCYLFVVVVVVVVVVE